MIAPADPGKPAKLKPPRQRAKAIERDLAIIRKFTEVYCARNHRPDAGSMCPECLDLFEYAEKRLRNCPYDPKPKCKDCPTHCYKASARAKMKEIMRFSGMHFVKRGRIDWLVKYFLS